MTVRSNAVHFENADTIREIRMPAWLMLAFDESDVQYAGTRHYDDDVKRVYRYDSRVHNHKQVAQGDVVVVRTRHSLVGFTQITRIESADGRKEVFRCPQCRATYIKRRQRVRPTYKCQKCGSDFDSPVQELVPCIKFAAHFGPFIDAPDAIPVDALRLACLRYNSFLSMQELDTEKFLAEVRRSAPQALILFQNERTRSLASSAEGESYSPSDEDRRNEVVRQIKERRGQSAFRAGLLERYGRQCQISGSKVLAVLEAAHISTYRGAQDNDLSNGLVLRTDLHTLFDLNLIGIHPDTLEIALAPSLHGTEYAELEYRKLLCYEKAPSRSALAIRWLEFEDSVNENEGFGNA